MNSNDQRKVLPPVVLWLVPLSFLIIFYFFPLGSIFQLSFARGESGLFQPFVEAFTSESVRRVVWFTIWQATLSTLLTLAIGLPGAFLFARYEFRGKALLQALSGIPFVMPTLVVAAAFNALLGPRGWINLATMELFDLQAPPIKFTNTIIAILVAHVFYNLTIVLRLVGDFWSHLDPRLTQAARTLGANRRRAFQHITLPLLAPAIATAALLVFIFDFTAFGVILILGGPRFATLEVEIYYQTISLFNLPLAAVLSILQLGCTLVLTIIYTRLSARVSRPITLRARQYTQKRMIALLLTLLTLPLIALATRSVVRLDPGRGQQSLESPGLTFDFYRELSINRRSSLFYEPPITAIAVSLGYAGATVLLA